MVRAPGRTTTLPKMTADTFLDGGIPTKRFDIEKGRYLTYHLRILYILLTHGFLDLNTATTSRQL